MSFCYDVIKALMGSAGLEPASSGYEPPALTIELRARKLASRQLPPMASKRSKKPCRRRNDDGTYATNAFVLLSRKPTGQELAGMAVACRRTKLNELIWAYFNIDGAIQDSARFEQGLG